MLRRFGTEPGLDARLRLAPEALTAFFGGAVFGGAMVDFFGIGVEDLSLVVASSVDFV